MAVFHRRDLTLAKIELPKVLGKLGDGVLNVSRFDFMPPFLPRPFPLVLVALRNLVPLLLTMAALVGVLRLVLSNDLSCLALAGSFRRAVAILVVFLWRCAWSYFWSIPLLGPVPMSFVCAGQS